MNLSRVSLGTMLFGSSLNKNESFAILDKFYELGGRVIDTAQMYPVPCNEKRIGLTEKIIGEWMDINNVKSEFFISSKISGTTNRIPFLNKQYSEIYGKEHLRLELKKNLSRLRIEKLDLLYLHWPTRETHNFGKGVGTNPNELYKKKSNIVSINKYIENVFELYAEGLIKNIGISNETPYGIHKYLLTLKKYNYEGDFYLQNPINLLSPTFVLTLQELCLNERIFVQAHSPLAFGLLSESKIEYLKDKNKVDKNSRFITYPNYYKRYLKERTNSFLIELDILARKKNLNIYDLAYGFLLNDPTITHIVIGPRTIIQLEKSVKSINQFKKNFRNVSEELYELINKYSIISY